MNKINNLRLIILSGALALMGCNPQFSLNNTNNADVAISGGDDDTTVVTIDSLLPKIDNFYLRQSDNPSLPSDIAGSIDHDAKVITVTLPSGSEDLLPSLVPQVSFTGTAINIGNTGQTISGAGSLRLDSLDFSEDVVLYIEGIPGQEATSWTVQVVVADALALISVNLEAIRPGQGSPTSIVTYDAVIDQNAMTIDVTVPYYKHNNNMYKLNIAFSGDSLVVDGYNTFTVGQTFVDLANPVDISIMSIYAGDTETQTFTLTVEESLPLKPEEFIANIVSNHGEFDHIEKHDGYILAVDDENLSELFFAIKEGVSVQSIDQSRFRLETNDFVSGIQVGAVGEYGNKVRYELPVLVTDRYNDNVPHKFIINVLSPNTLDSGYEYTYHTSVVPDEGLYLPGEFPYVGQKIYKIDEEFGMLAVDDEFVNLYMGFGGLRLNPHSWSINQNRGVDMLFTCEHHVNRPEGDDYGHSIYAQCESQNPQRLELSSYGSHEETEIVHHHNEHFKSAYLYLDHDIMIYDAANNHITAQKLNGGSPIDVSSFPDLMLEDTAISPNKTKAYMLFSYTHQSKSFYMLCHAGNDPSLPTRQIGESLDDVHPMESNGGYLGCTGFGSKTIAPANLRDKTLLRKDPVKIAVGYDGKIYVTGTHPSCGYIDTRDGVLHASLDGTGFGEGSNAEIDMRDECRAANIGAVYVYQIDPYNWESKIIKPIFTLPRVNNSSIRPQIAVRDLFAVRGGGVAVVTRAFAKPSIQFILNENAEYLGIEYGHGTFFTHIKPNGDVGGVIGLPEVMLPDYGDHFASIEDTANTSEFEYLAYTDRVRLSAPSRAKIFSVEFEVPLQASESEGMFIENVEDISVHHITLDELYDHEHVNNFTQNDIMLTSTVFYYDLFKSDGLGTLYWVYNSEYTNDSGEFLRIWHDMDEAPVDDVTVRMQDAGGTSFMSFRKEISQSR